MHKFRIPAIEENAGFVMISDWLKEEGDVVSQGESLMELLTDKASYTVDSEVDGYLIKIIAPEKSSLPPGSIVALIGDTEDECTQEILDEVQGENDRLLEQANDDISGLDGFDEDFSTGGEELVETEKKDDAHVSEEKNGGGIPYRASPKARELIREHGLNKDDVFGFTGKSILHASDIMAFIDRK